MSKNFDKIHSIVGEVKPNRVSILKATRQLELLMLNELIGTLTEIEKENADTIFYARPELTQKEAYDRWRVTAWSENNRKRIKKAQERLIELL